MTWKQSSHQETSMPSYYRRGEGYFTSDQTPETDWQSVNDCPHCDGLGCGNCAPAQPQTHMLVGHIVTTHESANPASSFNGGDYAYGFTRFLDYWTGQEIARRYWTSADFDYCPVYGQFGCSCSQQEHETLWTLDTTEWYEETENDL